MLVKNLIRLLRINLLQGWFGLSAETIKAKGRAVVLAPHPDDEVIGCGGLLARLVREERDVSVIVLSDGAESHKGCCDTAKEEIVKARRQLTSDAARIIGLPKEKVHHLDFPDGKIALGHPETDRLKRLIEDIRPDTVLVPHHGEGWSDHLATRELGIRLAPAGAEVWEYCVWFWYYNSWDISWRKAKVVRMSDEEHLLKLRAVDAYTLPVAPCGKPWSGVLPKVFMKANRTKTEVYFRVK